MSASPLGFGDLHDVPLPVKCRGDAARGPDDFVLKRVVPRGHDSIPAHKPKNPLSLIRGDFFDLSGDECEFIPDAPDQTFGFSVFLENAPQQPDVPEAVRKGSGLQIDQPAGPLRKMIFDLFLKLCMEDQIGIEGANPLDGRCKKTAHQRLLCGSGRIGAVIGDAAEPLLGAEGEDDFGDSRHQRHRPSRRVLEPDRVSGGIDEFDGSGSSRNPGP